GGVGEARRRRRERRDAGARGARGPRRGRADVGPAGERARGAPPAPLALGGRRVARVIAISSDLLLGSKVEATLTAARPEVTLSPALAEAPLNDADLLVADLEVENPEALVGLGIPVLAYYSHVDVDIKRAADAAGVDLVVPRSRMARELPDLVNQLLSG